MVMLIIVLESICMFLKFFFPPIYRRQFCLSKIDLTFLFNGVIMGYFYRTDLEVAVFCWFGICL